MARSQRGDMRSRTLVVLSFLAAAEAQSQERYMGIHCTPGENRACLELGIETVAHPDGAVRGPWGWSPLPMTEIRFRISNLQREGDAPRGLIGIWANPFELVDRPIPTFYPTADAFRTGGEGNTVQNGVVDFYADVALGSSGYSAGFRFDTFAGSALYGCAIPPGQMELGGPPLEPLYDATCGGSITYSVFVYYDAIRLSRELPTLSFSWSGGLPGDTFTEAFNRPWTGCTTGVDCVTATPEPATIALLATGLVGIAGARARRRRR
jgi:hypothetical protein